MRYFRDKISCKAERAIRTAARDYAKHFIAADDSTDSYSTIRSGFIEGAVGYYTGVDRASEEAYSEYCVSGWDFANRLDFNLKKAAGELLLGSHARMLALKYDQSARAKLEIEIQSQSL